MFHFGKSKSNPIHDSRKPVREDAFEVPWTDREDDMEIDDNVNYGVRQSLRKNRKLNAQMNMNTKITELQWMFRMSYAEAVKMIADVQRDKPKRTREQRSDLYLESNPDGEDKIAALKKRYASRCLIRYFINKAHNSFTWKNSNRTANRQWNRHEPTVHVPWTIGEETCATYLVQQREDEQERHEHAMYIAREMERENELELAAARWDAALEAEMDAFKELERRYDKGKWCLKLDTKPDLDRIDVLEQHFDSGAKVYRHAA
ncbi:hypothetical protein A3C09_03595 [Candidatus Uhrbacteria bacterium RIFCSPHIGHO2_02_FULL_47_44]|nr:MAG: hypothetical protein A3C09_03595 [Candidatus Uhrbacteria bacterium RIFCSPHIGHO2_02_FULL_47_44]